LILILKLIFVLIKTWTIGGIVLKKCFFLLITKVVNIELKVFILIDSIITHYLIVIPVFVILDIW